MNPLVSVIVPTYNRSALIGETIRSVLDQTFPTFELIVVNDGGDDEAQEIVESFRDPRIQYHKKENGGTASARNYGMARSIGTYIAFCDDDDTWKYDKLEKQIALMETKSDLVLLYSNANILSLEHPQGTLCFTKGVNTVWELLIKNPIPNSSVVIRRSALNAVGCFNPRFRLCEDYDLWLRIARVCTIDFINEPLVRYYHHSLGKSRLSLNATAKEDLQIIHENFQAIIRERPQRLSRAEQRKVISSIAFKKGKYSFFKHDDRARAAGLFVKSIMYDYRNVRPYLFLFFCLMGKKILYGLMPLYRTIFQREYLEFG